jgi:hypothetical protein
VSVIVAHTSFDAAPGGSADALAAALDLRDTIPFGPIRQQPSHKVVTFVPPSAADRVAAAMAEAGAGRIGRYEDCSFRIEGTGTFTAPPDGSPFTGAPGRFNTEAEVRIETGVPAAALDRVVAALVAAHPYEEPAFDVYDREGDLGFVGRIGRREPGGTLAALVDEVAQRLGGVLRVAGDPQTPIDRVAVVPGSGGGLIAAAAGSADVIVTGDVSHHRARDAIDRGLAVVDPGHAATERPGVASLYAAVSEVVGTVEDLGQLDSDPWRAP